MTGGKILALNEFDGFRTVISVRGIKDTPAFGTTPLSTTYYGEQLMFENDTYIALWSKFLDDQVGKCTQWTQAKNNISETEEEFIVNYPRLPMVPVQSASLTLIGHGYDPQFRYWLQFAGIAPLFRQSRWWVEDEEGDDYNPGWK